MTDSTLIAVHPGIVPYEPNPRKHSTEFRRMVEALTRGIIDGHYYRLVSYHDTEAGPITVMYLTVKDQPSIEIGADGECREVADPCTQSISS